MRSNLTVKIKGKNDKNNPLYMRVGNCIRPIKGEIESIKNAGKLAEGLKAYAVMRDGTEVDVTGKTFVGVLIERKLCKKR